MKVILLDITFAVLYLIFKTPGMRDYLISKNPGIGGYWELKGFIYRPKNRDFWRRNTFTWNSKEGWISHKTYWSSSRRLHILQINSDYQNLKIKKSIGLLLRIRNRRTMEYRQMAFRPSASIPSTFGNYLWDLLPILCSESQFL